MKKIFVLLCYLFLACPAYADKETIVLILTPDDSLAANKTSHVTAQLRHESDNSPVTDAELKIVHTQKFHLLVVDPTLTDYQHIHPTPGTTPGSYVFSFTPKLAGGYRAWADITPISTGKRQYAMADLGTPSKIGIQPNVADSAIIGNYHFTLEFDQPPTVGQVSIGTLTVTDDKGQPVTSLNPVMGAFAHIVGFYDDYKTIVHIHPMGAEPTSDTDRGGPKLVFHLEPDRVGFIKLFAQVNLEGHDVFVPFGVNVLVNK